jgi:hypothetical protein
MLVRGFSGLEIVSGDVGPEDAAPPPTLAGAFRRAAEFLRANGLRAGRFIACVPRLRYTPYHRMRKTNWIDAEIRRREEANARYMDSDHARLRAAISWWVRQTGNRVLLCPEMTYQLDLLAPLLYGPLPDDVKRSVVRREQYWLPDEAASVDARTAAVLSFECHSPILAAANGTPGLYLRQPEDGIKGRMSSDLGLEDWCLRVDETPEERVVEFVRSLTSGIRAAQKRVADAIGRVRMLQAKGASGLRSLFA